MSLLTNHIRPSAPSLPNLTTQIRHATLIRRPKRPYTFTQLITLSDGSTFTHRTTSPAPIYKSSKDTKNSPLWNPSSQKLLNVEQDEAGRLQSFRQRFGRGFDVEALDEGEEAREGEASVPKQRQEESLLDLISSVGQEAEKKGEAAGETKGAASAAKAKAKGKK